MKKLIAVAMAACLFLAFGIPASAAATVEDLAGKWSLTHTNDEGAVVTQSLEIKGGKFTFRIVNTEKKSLLFARGDVKVQSVNALNLVSFVHIDAGDSAEDANPVDEDRQCVYVLDGGTLSIALDFDKNRGKGPRIEVYAKDKSK